MQNPMDNPAPMTLEAFLAWEMQQPDRHEFADGTIYAMSGASKRHNRIARRLANLLERHAGDCDVYGEAVKLIAAGSLYYPDVVMTCDERDEADPYSVRYPRIVAEVLSPSNRGVASEKKLSDYATLETLQHVLIVAQDERRIMHYRFTGRDEGVVHIVRNGALDVGFPIELDELYAGIRFGATG